MAEAIVIIGIVLTIVSLIVGLVGAIKYLKGKKTKTLMLSCLCLFIVGIIAFSVGMNQVGKEVERKAEQSMLKAIEESDFEENVEEAMQEAKDEMDAVTEENSNLAEAARELEESRGN